MKNMQEAIKFVDRIRRSIPELCDDKESQVHMAFQMAATLEEVSSFLEAFAEDPIVERRIDSQLAGAISGRIGRVICELDIGEGDMATIAKTITESLSVEYQCDVRTGQTVEVK